MHESMSERINVPPLSCYTCRFFIAFKEAPHKEALKKMLEDKQKVIDLGNLVVAKKLDAPIAACQAIIQRCQETD